MSFLYMQISYTETQTH